MYAGSQLSSLPNLFERRIQYTLGKGSHVVQSFSLNNCVILLLVALPSQLATTKLNAANWHVGLAKADITPEVPVRLSGYASRTQPFSGVADRLSARVMVFSPANGTESSKRLVVVSLDSIVSTSQFTVSLSKWLDESFGIQRSQLVVCSTHSHAAPHLDGGLENLFTESLSEEERHNISDYTANLQTTVRKLVKSAIDNEVPAQIQIGTSQATFAANRRMIREGKWSGFGVQEAGAVDHRVRFFKAIASDGDILGGAFQYACHCTTLGGGFEKVSGDWAGLAAAQLEKIHPESVFLPVIGCGADSNPNPRGSYELSQQYAAQIVDAVQKLVEENNLPSLSPDVDSTFGYVAIAPEQPESQDIEKRLESTRPNERRWAEHMLATKKEMGRLPESYPMPVHCWNFGDQLSWVFLGGEVVVDYQYLIEKELSSQETWVAAYTDDVFAYVASESMRSEGGYEVDSSMIYYLQPGRWQSGTQDLILRRVREIARGENIESEALSPEEGLAAVRVPDDYVVELVAAEPLVQDPINISFASDGRVWVCEMSDYPLGSTGGGRVRWLKDTDGDGKLDESHLFIDGLDYPTSVHAWRDGVIVISAPDVFWARDTDGDGKADDRQVLLSGIHPANPQHRASGFEIGLDGWLHFGAGDGTRQLKSHLNGQTYDVHRHDVAWNPDTGEIRTTAGETQFVRARDEFGNWFGNSNSRPMYQYVIEHRYEEAGAVSGGLRHDLLEPAVAPPVLPRSQVLSRFNDLFALNRFTSACSSIVARVPGVETSDGYQVGFICEPVHNMVARIEMRPEGSHFVAERHHDDLEYDFFASTDPWSRPVRVVNAPDGSIWVVDMVRKVIEHPEWIPTAWQERINLRAGEGKGRIYRVFRKGFEPQNTWEKQVEDPENALLSNNGAIRDIALQDTLAAGSVSHGKLRAQLPTSSSEVRGAIYSCLQASGQLKEADLQRCLKDGDPRVVRIGLRLLESQKNLGSKVLEQLSTIARQSKDHATDMQWLLTVNCLELDGELAGWSQIVSRCIRDQWCLKALALTSDSSRSFAAVRSMLNALDEDGSGELTSPTLYRQQSATLKSLWEKSDASERTKYASEKFANREQFDSLTQSDLMLLSLVGQAGDQMQLKFSRAGEFFAATKSSLLDPQEQESKRLKLLQLYTSRLVPIEDQLEIAEQILQEESSGKLKLAVLNALFQVESSRVPELVIATLSDLPISLRPTACSLLLTRKSNLEILVNALENGDITRADLDPATIQSLRSHWDRDLRTRCLTVFGALTPRRELVESYLKRMNKPHATEQGKQLYVENCAACHQSSEGKVAFAPPLENLKHWTVGQWVTAILDPNQTVEPKYHQSKILTVDDRVLTGLVLQQNQDTIKLGLSDGSSKEIELAEVEQIQKSQLSLMPEGMEQKVSPEQLAELIGYLRSK